MNRRDQSALRLHAHWLLYFHYVAKLRSIRGAATQLNVSPSSISRSIKEIEAILGAQLLEKLPRSLRLTAAGEVVAHHARNTLRDLIRVEDLLDELRGLRRGHVNVAAIQAVAADLFPSILTAFRQKNPKITVTCVFVGSQDVAERIKLGHSEVGVAFNVAASSGLRHVLSIPVPFGAIMAPDNPLANRATIRLLDLVDSGIPLILPDEHISTRSILNDLLRDSSLELAPAITASYPDFIVSLARMGAGIAFQTPIGIERELREGSLKFVPLVEKRLRAPTLSVLVGGGRPISLAADLLAEAIRGSVAELLRNE